MNKIEICRTKAIIEPSEIIRKRDDFPKIGVSCFSLRLLKKTAEKYNGEQISSLITVAGRVPIFKIRLSLGADHIPTSDAAADGKDNRPEQMEIALIPAAVGAPACVAGFEECIAMGLTTLVLFGSCGILIPHVRPGTIIVPVAAIRDEGTSMHYLGKDAPEEIQVDPYNRDVIKSVMVKQEINYLEGKTWTTDGVYRETREKVRQHTAAGAVCVEMECAAMLAAGLFRGVNVLPFFFGADSLSDEKWAPEGLGDPLLHDDEKKMSLALQIASEFA